MERVETLSNLLAEKLRNKAPVQELLNTVKMLESELMHLKNSAPEGADKSAVTVNISKKSDPVHIPQQTSYKTATPAPPEEEEKTVEVLQIDEAEVEAELEEIKKHAEERNKISIQNKPLVMFDAVDDIPTLAGRQAPSANNVSLPPKEIHELIPVNNAASVNESLRKHQSEPELGDKLQDTPVKDLKKAIGVNDRYTFINELFRGDEAMYERSIKTINGFAIFPEAEYWIRRELKLKLGWDDKNETVKQFDQLVRRRFA